MKQTGCFVVYDRENRVASRPFTWDNEAQRTYMRERAIGLARNLSQPATVEEFINTPHTGYLVWPTQGESK